MARNPLCLLLLRRISLSQRNRRPHSFSHFSSSSSSSSRALRPDSSKPFSTASSPDPTKPSNLSARLSFVFDQIDAIERERSQKDQTLQKIRAWRESKHAQNANTQSAESAPDSPQNGIREEAELGRPHSSDSARSGLEAVAQAEVELVHPWPEWIELMERLVQQNYFDHKRRDEGKMTSALGFDVGEDAGDDTGIDFTRDLKTVQTAGLNFGKDRFDILRSLSRQDIQILVGYGCPSADKKVVFSAKLLRKHVHFDEGDVCSSCSLRSSCERAYLVTNKEDEARTIDVMRVLMAFGLDHFHGTVTNESVLKQKSVKTVVQKLLHEVGKLCSVPIDPSLPPPIIKRKPPKVKQPPPPPRKRVGRDDVEMKKGDWLCPKCDFMNFAKNTVCLQCDAKRPKRQLLPGEWECPQCNFLNYRRNVDCFHCECKRPPDQFMEDRLQDTKQNLRVTGPEKTPKRTEISNAWNFDFDDDESDGADVAAFEYADSSAAAKDSRIGRNFEVPEEDFRRDSRFSNVRDVDYSNSERKGSRVGFDDFDEEDDDDDVDSYELDSARSNVPSRDFSELERDSDFEDGGSDGNDLLNQGRAQTHFSPSRPSKSTHQRGRFSGSDEDESGVGSDDELSAHPNWRSSHVADSGKKSGGGRSQSRRPSYGSDEELGLDSDDDDGISKRFGSRKNGLKDFSGKRRGSQNLYSDSEISDDDDFSSRRSSKLKGGRGGSRADDDYGLGKRFDSRKNGLKDFPGKRRNLYSDSEVSDDGDFSSRRSSKLKGSRGGSRDDDDGLGKRFGSRKNGLKDFSGKMRANRNLYSDSEVSDDDDFGAPRSRGGSGDRRRGSGLKRNDSRNSPWDARSKSSGPMVYKRRSYAEDDFDMGRPSRGSRGGNRGGRSRGADFGGRRMDRNNREGGGGSRSFRGRKEEDKFERRQPGKFGKYDKERDGDDDFRNMRRVIER